MDGDKEIDTDLEERSILCYWSIACLDTYSRRVCNEAFLEVT